MRIFFSMDGIKNIDQLYTWPLEHQEERGDVRVEHYHGDDYCKNVVTDVFKALAPSDWAYQKYLGSRQRVPEFDNINTNFLSMTLETLAGVIFDGVIFKDDFILSRQDYTKVQEMGDKQKVTGRNIADYIKARRIVDKKIWDDLFVPYIDNPDAFKTAAHAFIEDRNHVAHSKVLSWSSYQVILKDFKAMGSLILSADAKFEREETADEVLQTWEAEHEDAEYEREYYRDRLASETGMDILDESGIKDWFDEILYEIFGAVYQRYHLDVCYEISEFATPAEEEIVFSISCPAVEADSAKIDTIAEYSIDDDLGEDSTCYIVVKGGTGEEICKAEVHFHNGNGYEGEEGIMEATDNSEYDTSELDDFLDELFATIESLNPYPAKLDALTYENKGEVQFVADFPCEQCGKFGVSINETFLTVGRCCYCGYENELERCERCGKLVNADALEHGFCPSSAAYIDEQ